MSERELIDLTGEDLSTTPKTSIRPRRRQKPSGKPSSSSTRRREGSAMDAKEKLGLPAYNAAELLAPVSTLRATVALGKSRMFRDKAAKFLNSTTMEGCVVIAVDRHDLGVEQLGRSTRSTPTRRWWRASGGGVVPSIPSRGSRKTQASRDC